MKVNMVGQHVRPELTIFNKEALFNVQPWFHFVLIESQEAVWFKKFN